MKILLLNTDDLKHQLKNQKLVELAQKRYASMLHYYLKSQHLENHSTLLARGLMLVKDTQRIYDLLLERLKLFRVIFKIKIFSEINYGKNLTLD